MSNAPQPSLSPLATPPKQRTRKPDPFLDLANSPIPSPLASPASADRDASQDEPQEPFLSKLVLTPLLFASFIFSLLIVDRRNRAYRLAEHPPSRSSSWWTRFSPWQWLDPQPYQDPADSTWQDASAGKTRGSDGSVPGIDRQADLGKRKHTKDKQGQKRWFVGKKHRKIARLEFGEALEMRWKVMIALAVLSALVLLAMLWFAKKLVQGVW
ncbi:hypothetical protein B0J12DRAFT_238705 [Macrophomina phaseolina]|uniref:Uncharacterized protein n=1 Tax=Macrophomina phaseolina TaxID=35725 RepID=A0ABQ8GQL6_9PEZI|nr:hypothetical protein B0J12DRAFT_238705 [Macrophomina phaseolina]